MEVEVRILNNVASRTRLAILWLFWDVAFVGTLLLTLMIPGMLEVIIEGQAFVVGLGWGIGSEALLLFAVIVLIPLVMAFLTVTLKDSIARWANVVMGIVALVASADGLYGQYANPYAFQTLMWIVEVIVGALIVWYAYRWSGKEA